MSVIESSPTIFQHGSAWVQADFHLHTQADKEFSYSGTSFVTDYVGALKAAGIRVGVIANHNKFDRDEFRALAKEIGRAHV
jgi:predicted metal-dependent phosphoesterase TrpH